MEEDEETCGIAISRTKIPVLWGAKSGFGREATSGRENITGMGLELKTLTTNAKERSLGLDELQTGNYINSQRKQYSVPVHDKLSLHFND